MTIELMAIIFTGVSVLIGLITFIIARSQDIQRSGVKEGALINTLQNIAISIEDLKDRFDKLEERFLRNENKVSELYERIIKVEESAKAAHHRQDEFNDFFREIRYGLTHNNNNSNKEE